jgi:hypothetical protein
VSPQITSAQVGSVYTTSTELFVKECCVCGITFAYPDELDDHAREYNSAEYPGRYVTIACPAGHKWHYTGRNEEQRLRDRLSAERQRSGRLAAQRDQLEASRNAHKGQATRARKERDRLTARAKAGVCPCCNRTFKQLARHMKAKHPDFEADPENAPAPREQPGA